MTDQEATRILNDSPWVRTAEAGRNSGPFHATVLWESSAAVRQAVAKVFGPFAVPKNGEAYYVISVRGFPIVGCIPRNVHADSPEELAEVMLEACRASTTLNSGKVKRSAIKVLPYIRGNQRMFFFLFSRDSKIAPDEKEVVFETHTAVPGGRALDLKAKFKPQELVYLGTPDF